MSGEPYPVTCSLLSLQHLFWRGGGPVFPTSFQVPSVYVIPGLNTPLTAIYQPALKRVLWEEAEDSWKGEVLGSDFSALLRTGGWPGVLTPVWLQTTLHAHLSTM